MPVPAVLDWADWLATLLGMAVLAVLLVATLGWLVLLQAPVHPMRWPVVILSRFVGATAIALCLVLVGPLVKGALAADPVFSTIYETSGSGTTVTETPSSWVVEVVPFDQAPLGYGSEEFLLTYDGSDLLAACAEDENALQLQVQVGFSDLGTYSGCNFSPSPFDAPSFSLPPLPGAPTPTPDHIGRVLAGLEGQQFIGVHQDVTITAQAADGLTVHPGDWQLQVLYADLPPRNLVMHDSPGGYPDSQVSTVCTSNRSEGFLGFWAPGKACDGDLGSAWSPDLHPAVGDWLQLDFLNQTGTGTCAEGEVLYDLTHCTRSLALLEMVVRTGDREGGGVVRFDFSHVGPDGVTDCLSDGSGSLHLPSRFAYEVTDFLEFSYCQPNRIRMTITTVVGSFSVAELEAYGDGGPFTRPTTSSEDIDPGPQEGTLVFPGRDGTTDNNISEGPDSAEFFNVANGTNVQVILDEQPGGYSGTGHIGVSCDGIAYTWPGSDEPGEYNHVVSTGGLGCVVYHYAGSPGYNAGLTGSGTFNYSGRPGPAPTPGPTPVPTLPPGSTYPPSASMSPGATYPPGSTYPPDDPSATPAPPCDTPGCAPAVTVVPGSCAEVGPLSGVLGKPLICTNPVTHCDDPGSFFDIPAYVGCLIGNVIGVLVNIPITIINAIIDLVLPGPAEIGNAIGEFFAQMGQYPPMIWVNTFVEQVSSGLPDDLSGTPCVLAPSIVEFPIVMSGGHSIIVDIAEPFERMCTVLSMSVTPPAPFDIEISGRVLMLWVFSFFSGWAILSLMLGILGIRIGGGSGTAGGEGKE